MNRSAVRVGGREVKLSNLEKELYPSYGFTKAQVLDYYRQISPFILPHLHGRALTLKRYPEGVDRPFFFEKRCPPYRPSFVATARIPLKQGGKMTACLVNDLETLVWVGNLASLELHVPLARADSPGLPDAVVFDLDPGEGAGIGDCARVALLIRAVLDRLHLKSFPKTSGMKGLHVFVPLNRKGVTFVQAREFSKAVAAMLQRDHPDLVTTLLAKPERRHRVFINWAQNSSTKTMVAVYSLRARASPAVSFPLEWPEVERAAAGRAKLVILADEAVRRAGKYGDRFEQVLTVKQALPRL